MASLCCVPPPPPMEASPGLFSGEEAGTWMSFPGFEKHRAARALKGSRHYLCFAVADSGNQAYRLGDSESLLASACIHGNKSCETS